MKIRFLKILSIALAFTMLASSFGFIKSNFQKNYVQRDFVKSQIQVSVLEKNVKSLNLLLGCDASMENMQQPYFIGDFVVGDLVYDVVLSKNNGQFIYSFIHQISDKSLKLWVEKWSDKQNSHPESKTNMEKSNLGNVSLICHQKTEFKIYLLMSENLFAPVKEHFVESHESSVFIPPCKS